MKPRYTAEVRVTGGREGHAVSSDGLLDVKMRRPKTNGDNEGTNPEQLFAAAWGACFLGALGGVTRETGVDISNATLDVTIGIGEDTVNGGSGLMATISLAIPGMDLAEVQCLADQAHTTCPYSKATRGNIPVQVVAVESVD
jgi:Ohr subfamily peroxiredoxin